MAWVELHQSLWTHKKTLIMASILDIKDLYAAAHMAKLWTWALDNAQDGDLTGLPNKVIAIGAGWDGEPNEFVEAALKAGWLEKDEKGLYIHDWYDYAGKLIDKKNANKERMRQARSKRASHVHRTDGTRDMHVQGLPNHTLPNHTEHNAAASSARAHEEVNNEPTPPPTKSESFYSAHHRIFGFYCTDKQAEILGSYLDEGVEEAVLIRAMDRAATNGTGYKFGLIVKIINDYIAGKAKTLAEAEALDRAFDETRKARGDPPEYGVRRSRQQQQIDELRRIKEEERRREQGRSG